MTMLPACALDAQAFVAARKITADQRTGAKQGRFAASAEIQAHLQIFDDVATG
ncbi:hypothetical protein D3C84_664910 [compost metagenome]